MRDSVKVRSPLADAEDESKQDGKEEAALRLRLTGLAHCIPRRGDMNRLRGRRDKQLPAMPEKVQQSGG
jgi:hypothetical protein